MGEGTVVKPAADGKALLDDGAAGELGASIQANADQYMAVLDELQEVGFEVAIHNAEHSSTKTMIQNTNSG